MARLPRGLAIVGLAIALAGAAQPAAAAPVGTIHVADDDVTSDTPPDVPSDTPPDVPSDMPTDIPTATPTVIPTATPTVTPTPTPTATPTPNPAVIAAAIQQVIQRSNDEQVQAIATRNLSLIADTLTSEHVPELASILQDMLDHKVNSIALLKLDWGPIVVAADGTSAVATTTETWRIVSQAGSVDDEPQRNEYTLVLDNATWKIKSDVQVGPPAQAPVPPR